MLEGIEVLCHSSIRIKKENKVIYFDPFKVDRDINDADYIFITHNHYDHFSKEDILKVKNNKTVIIVTMDLVEEVLPLGFDTENIISVIPNISYEKNGIKFKTIPAYNENKYFHPKTNNWVGYIVQLNGYIYYIAGDTDITMENKMVKCDVAFVPIGGTYTMNLKEAADLINKIKPKVVIPIHYGTIVGTKEDANKFMELINSDIKCNILIK